MKLSLFIILGLTFLLCGLSPQLHTRLRPMWPTEPRHYALALMLPRTIIRFEVVRR
jgi:hypothetical protein